MIGRLLVAGALLISLVAGLGLAAVLEVDRAGATTVWLPVTVSSSSADLIYFRADGAVAEALRPDDRERSWDEPDTGFVALTLDADGRVTAAQLQDERPADDRVWLRVRTSASIMPTSTRLPESDHDSVRYVRLKISGGEAYEAGLADEDLTLLGRGDRAW